MKLPSLIFWKWRESPVQTAMSQFSKFNIPLSTFTIFLILLLTLAISVFLGNVFFQRHIETYVSTETDLANKDMLDSIKAQFGTIFDRLFATYYDERNTGTTTPASSVTRRRRLYLDCSCDTLNIDCSCNIAEDDCSDCDGESSSDGGEDASKNILDLTDYLISADLTLDDYISAYYNQFWNSDRNMYSDDYLLKTEVAPSIYPVSHHHHFTNCKDVKNVDDEVGKINTKIDNILNKLGDISLAARTPAPTSSAASAPVPTAASAPASTPSAPAPAPAPASASYTPADSTPAATTTSTSPTAYQAPPLVNTPVPPPNSRGLQGNLYGDVAGGCAKPSFSSYSASYVPPSPMNYMNSVPASTSNFIPVTADFSKFV